jgi:nicotinamide-nucleotide amidase
MTGGAIEEAARRLLERLMSQQITVTTAESCTGGLIAAAITAIPGSSAVFLSGHVTYANEAKIRMLGVPAEMIAEHGAVSAQVARAMAEGALAATPEAILALSVTGIAGPGGGSAQKPVGLVHLGAARRGAATRLSRHVFPGDRASVRTAAALAAFALAEEMLA